MKIYTFTRANLRSFVSDQSNKRIDKLQLSFNIKLIKGEIICHITN